MFSKRLAALRKQKGLTQIDLAREIGVSNGTVGMWETARRRPDLETVRRLAAYFGVTTDYLLGAADEPAEEAPFALSMPKDYDQLTAEERESIDRVISIILKNREK